MLKGKLGYGKWNNKESEEVKWMITVCKENMCTGCMACVEVCNKDAIKIVDSLKSYNALIEEDKCIGCNKCKHVCQNNERVELKKPQSWHQGWSENETIRTKAASGGLASSLMKAFIEKKDGYVCGCTFVEGEFQFKITNQTSEIHCFAGSKYVKSNPKGIYKEIKMLLKNGKNVLFVGLPCQVAGLKKYIGRWNSNLYTVDLICHGTPSPILLDKYLKEHNVELKKIKDLRFREKNNFRLSDVYTPITNRNMPDRFLFAFLKSLIYTENCYHCNYAEENRVSDITLGDSWGSTLPMEEQKKGISLIMCQNEKGEELLDLSEVHLKNVERIIAMEHNGQLNSPASYNSKRDLFFALIKKGKKFDRIIFKLYPGIFIRQYIKFILKKVKIIRGGGTIN